MKPSDPWNPNYPEEFEELFEDTFDKVIETIPLYTMEDKRRSWQSLQQRVEHVNRRRIRQRRYRLSALVVISMVLGGVLFSEPVLTQAVSPIYQKMTSWGIGMNKIVFRNANHSVDDLELTKDLSSLDMVEMDSMQIVPKAELIESEGFAPALVSLNEARLTLPFELPEITYVPDRFTFNTVELMSSPNHSQVDNVYLSYYNDDDQQLKMIFNLINENEFMTSITNDHTEEFQLDNDTIAYYSPGTLSSLSFTVGNVLAQIFSTVDEEELLLIANGIK